jgi:hypothetical protein
MRYDDKVALGGLFFISFYIVFWLWFFDAPKPLRSIAVIPQKSSVFETFNNAGLVLGTESNPQIILPSSYKTSTNFRKQFFNLSCEFAAASGIIFHFTNDPVFAPNNEEKAEKELISKAWISKNPNIGIRMGSGAESLDSLYANLNKRFGGADYYGIHAPPFINLFANYNLAAKPIYINDLTIFSIRKAIAGNNLIMAWIKIGYAGAIDEELSYGKIKIVRGEHAVIINGYDESGVIVMDPGIGLERHIGYSSLIEAATPFSMPFLEISKGIESKTFLDNLTIGFDTQTGIERSIPKIYVKNGAGQAGAANQMRDILRDFGYSVSSIENADNFDYQDVSMRGKQNFFDFLYILARDIKLADYTVASLSADLSAEEKADIMVVVGR